MEFIQLMKVKVKLQVDVWLKEVKAQVPQGRKYMKNCRNVLFVILMLFNLKINKFQTKIKSNNVLNNRNNSK